MAALHSFRQARSRSRRAAIYGDRVFPKYLRKVFACGRRKILRRCAPLNDKSGGVPVLLSFRAKRGIFASADALPRPGLPHGGTPGWLLLASPIHLQVDCEARRRGDTVGRLFSCGQGTGRFRLKARYFARGGKVPKTPPGVPGPRERGLLWNWPGGGGGYFQGGLQNLKAGKPTHQTWQKCTAKRGILTRPLRGLQRQDGVSTPGHCARRRRRRCGGFACGRDGVRPPCMAALRLLLNVT